MTTSPARDFVKLAYALGKAKGDLVLATELGSRLASPRAETILRAAVGFGSTSDADFAADLVDYRTVSDGFMASLQSASLLDWLAVNGAPRIPARSRVVVSTGTLTGIAGVDEAAIKRLGTGSFDLTEVPVRKVAGLIAISEELFRFTPAQGLSLLETELRAAAIKAANDELITYLASQLESAATVALGSDPLGSIAEAVGVLGRKGVSPMVIAVHPDLLVTWAFDERSAFDAVTPWGGSLRGITLLPCDSLAEAAAMLVAVDGIALDPGQPVISVSRHADLLMDDAATGAQELTSLWQTNTIAMKVERWSAFNTIRPYSAVLIEG